MFQMQKMVRRETQISPFIVGLMDDEKANALNRQLKEVYPQSEALVYTSGISHKSFGVLYVEEAKAQEAIEMWQELLEGFKEHVCVEVLNPDYWALRKTLQKTVLTHGFKVNANYNTTNRDVKVAIPKFAETMQWKYAE